MKGQFKLGILISIMVASVSGVASAEMSTIDYVRQDGRQFIEVNQAEKSVKFVSKSGQKSDLGGAVKQCGAAGAGCLNLSGYFLSVPKEGAASTSWSAGGADFTIVGHADHGDGPVWLIQVSVKGDAYMFYTFSRKRGVESISLQQEKADPSLAKTYFLVGDHGLLAQAADVKTAQP